MRVGGVLGMLAVAMLTLSGCASGVAELSAAGLWTGAIKAQ